MVKKILAIALSLALCVSSFSFNFAASVVKGGVEEETTEVKCDHIFTQEDIDNLPTWITDSHTFKAGDKAFIGAELPANCEEDGWKLMASDESGFCLKCGAYVGEKQPLKATGHDMKITKEVSCEEDGLKECTHENYQLVKEQIGGYWHSTYKKVKCPKTEVIEHPGHDCKIDPSKHVNPTCEEKGSDTFVCQNKGCDYSYTEDIGALGHDYKEEVIIAPTCDKTGEIKYTCQRKGCGYTYTDYPSSLGHKCEIDPSKHVNPTCEEKGSDTFVCQRKGCDYSYTEDIDALGHDWKIDQAQHVDPTCTEDGRDVKVCQRKGCGKSEVITIPKLGHNFDEGKVVDPTCTEDGYTLYTCQNKGCGYTEKRDVKKPLGHDWKENESKHINPTCEKDGEATFECQREGCEAEDVRVIPALGHDMKVDESKHIDPTCTSKGSDTYVCQREGCEYTYDEEIDMLPHNYEVTEQVLPTCTEEGYNVYTCVGCGAAFIEPLAPLGHTFDETFTRPANCVHGTITSGICTRCHEWISTDDGVLDYSINFRNSDDAKFMKLPSEIAEDTYMVNYYDATDSKYYDEHPEMFSILRRISSTGHRYKSTYTKATCELDGYWTLTCTRKNCPCPDEETSENYVIKVINSNSAIGHNWVKKSDPSDKDPTCTEEGCRHWMCLNDHSHTYTEILPATGHKPTLIGSFEATCVEGGYDLYKCDVCGYEWKQYTTPKLAHNYKETSYIAPTCTTQGVRTFTCSMCGDSYKSYEPSIGHRIEVVDQKDATCTTDGYIKKKCANCEYTEFVKLPATGHTFDGPGVVTPATCEEEGYTTFTCSVCKEDVVVKTADKLGHNYKTEVTTPSSFEKTGVISEVCATCGKLIVKDSIPAIKTVKVAHKSYVYSGKKIKDPLVIKDSKGYTISSKYYTLSYSNNKKIGTAKVKVTFRGNYSGTKTLKYKIVPKGIGISKTSTTKGKIKYSWGRVKNATGYKIQYSTSKKFKKAKKLTVKNRKTCVKYLKNLKSGKKYYVRVRAYKKVSGKNYYGAWSSSSRVCK